MQTTSEDCLFRFDEAGPSRAGGTMAPFGAMFMGAFWHPLRDGIKSEAAKALQKAPWAAPDKELQVSRWHPRSAGTTLDQVEGG